MSYYYSNPGGFSISKTVLPSVTSSICQSAGLNSGGVVRESATVSTTSTAVGPYVQQLSGGGGSSSSTGGSVIKINIVNGGSGYRVVPTIQITGGGGSGATATCTISGGSINSVTITNAGSGYTSAPTVTVTPVLGIVNLQAVISSGSSSTSASSSSFQQVVDNDPKLILLK